MKQSISEGQFIEAFDRMDRGNNFSQGGRSFLFEYLCECEEGTGEEIELDVIALCCEWSEYPSIEEAAQEYQCTPSELWDRTTLIEVFPSQDIESYSNGVLVLDH